MDLAEEMLKRADALSLELAQSKARIRELEGDIVKMDAEVNKRISLLHKEYSEKIAKGENTVSLKFAISEFCDLQQIFISEIKALSDKSNQSDKEDEE